MFPIRNKNPKVQIEYHAMLHNVLIFLCPNVLKGGVNIVFHRIDSLKLNQMIYMLPLKIWYLSHALINNFLVCYSGYCFKAYKKIVIQMVAII